MTRLALILLLALAPATALGAGVTVSSGYAVEKRTVTRPDPTVRGHLEGRIGPLFGGIRAATDPEPQAAGNVDLYLGIRPRIRDLAIGLSYEQGLEECCGTVAMQLDRPLGARTRLGARVRIDTAGLSALTEARATVAVARGTEIGGGVGSRFSENAGLGYDVGLTRRLAGAYRFDLRYRDPVAAGARAEIALQAKF